MRGTTAAEQLDGRERRGFARDDGAKRLPEQTNRSDGTYDRDAR